MEKKFICGKDKYELGGLNTDLIFLPVSFENIPQEIKAQEYTLYFPTPFHVSLVYIGKIVKKYSISIPDFLNKIVGDFCNFIKTNPIEVIRYNNEFRLANRDGKKTIVVMCEVSNLNKFFDFVNQKYKLNIKYTPTHVTLYNTVKGEPGISLMDLDDIKNFTVPIENPIGRLL